MSVASTNQVWALRGLKDYQRLTLLAFADWADATGMAWFTLPTLAAKLDVNESTARRHRDWAISKGHLTIVKQVKGRGGKTYYKLTLNGSSSEPQEAAEKGVTFNEKGSTAMPPFSDGERPRSDKEAPQKAAKKGGTSSKKGVTFEQNPSHARRERYKQPIGLGRSLPTQPNHRAREPLAEKAPINSNEVNAEQGDAKALLITAGVNPAKAAQLARDTSLAEIQRQEAQYQIDLKRGEVQGPGALVKRLEHGNWHCKDIASPRSYSQDAPALKPLPSTKGKARQRRVKSASKMAVGAAPAKPANPLDWEADLFACIDEKWIVFGPKRGQVRDALRRGVAYDVLKSMIDNATQFADVLDGINSLAVAA